MQASMQASLFAKNSIMTILIQNVNNTMAGYQKEILPSSWSPIKYSVIILTVGERSVRSKHKKGMRADN